jgi:hypothetical protein
MFNYYLKTIDLSGVKTDRDYRYAENAGKTRYFKRLQDVFEYCGCKLKRGRYGYSGIIGNTEYKAYKCPKPIGKREKKTFRKYEYVDRFIADSEKVFNDFGVFIVAPDGEQIEILTVGYHDLEVAQNWMYNTLCQEVAG